MNTTLNRLHRDERGMSYVFVGVGFMAFLAATTLAIDVGMFMTARAQAQNAADAGALAGAVALYYDDYDNRSASGPAVQNAIMAGQANLVMGQAPSITPQDVSFPVGPSGLNNRVKVVVHRTDARSNPLLTFTGRFFGVPQADVWAEATAEASPANAMTCVKPFTIPDKWIERQTPPWDPDDTFDVVDNKGNPLPNPDIYIPSTETGYTGYNADRDRGVELMIRAGTGNNITPSFYFSYAIGGYSGADEYRWNIANCNTTVMGFGDLLLAEPGNMVGPTMAGIDELIAKDPGAYWDTTLNKPVSTMNPSPRVVAIPLYDPIYYDTGKRNGREADLKVANYMGFFITRRQGNNVYGRITPISGLIAGNMGPAPVGAFPMAIRLVE
ncbi:MAG TPA: pilus assembly protein TadG-related protein [Vicinamibacterales bacterium]